MLYILQIDGVRLNNEAGNELSHVRYTQINNRLNAVSNWPSQFEAIALDDLLVAMTELFIEASRYYGQGCPELKPKHLQIKFRGVLIDEEGCRFWLEGQLPKVGNDLWLHADTLHEVGDHHFKTAS